jgi:hypothetical protein
MPSEDAAPGSPQPQAVPPYLARPQTPGSVPPAGPGATAGAPAPAPKPVNRKLVLWLSIGGGALVVIVVSVLVAVSMFSISSADYRQAYAQASTADSAFSYANRDISSVLTSAMSSSGASSGSMSSSITKARESLHGYEQANTKLSEEKAMRDSTVKKQLQTYQKKTSAYQAYADGLLKSAPALGSFSTACSKTPYTSAYDSGFAQAYSTYTDNCSKALKQLSQAPDKDLAKLGTSIGAQISQLADVVSQLTAVGNPNDLDYSDPNWDAAYQNFSDLDSQLTDVTESLQSSVRKFQTSAEASANAADPSQALSALTDTLMRKAR